MDSEYDNPNQDPKEHIILALARTKQSIYLLKTLELSFSLIDPLMLHIYDIQKRAFYMDLYILFDKQNKHLNLRKVIVDNKRNLKNKDYVELIKSFDSIETRYSKLITTIHELSNSIIRHLDPNMIPIIYGDYFNEKYATEFTEVSQMIDDIIDLFKTTNFFKNELFKHFDNIVQYCQIIRRLNLEIDINRLEFLKSIS